MAQLKNTLIQGSAKVTGTLYANTLDGALNVSNLTGLGTAGQVLTVNSGATGVTWATPSAGVSLASQSGQIYLAGAASISSTNLQLSSVTLATDGTISTGGVAIGGSNFVSGDEGGEIQFTKAPNGALGAILDIIYENSVDKLRLRSSAAAGVYVDLTNNILYGAGWNDYAEYRKSTEQTPGRCVQENDDGCLTLANKRLIPGACIISDTYGFSQGETNEAKTPVAVAGRVLVYPYRDRRVYHAGMAVCSAPNGTVDFMTRDEIRDYPDCIIGIVSEIPNYEKWGTNNVKVDGRIWVKVK